MFLLKQILPGALLAAFIAGAVLAIAGIKSRFSKTESGARDVAFGAAIAPGLAYACGHAMLSGRPVFPPTDATNWLFFFALIGAIFGLIDALPIFRARRAPRWLRAIVWLPVCAGLLRVLLAAKFQPGSDWPLAEALAWLIALALGVLFFTWCFEKLGARESTSSRANETHADDFSSREISTLFVAAIVCGGACAALMLSGSLLLGELAVVLTASVCASLVAAWFFPKLPFSRGVAPALALLLASLLICGHFYAELPASSALLLAAAPFAALLISRTKIAARSFWKTLFLRACAAAAPVAIAAFIAFRASPPLDY